MAAAFRVDFRSSNFLIYQFDLPVYFSFNLIPFGFLRHLRHKWVHKRHLPKSEYPFQCSACDAAFIRPEVLNDHMNFHKGIRPYKCMVCPKTYSDRSGLMRHRKQHELKKKRQEMVEAKTVQLENLKHHSVTRFVFFCQLICVFTYGPNSFHSLILWILISEYFCHAFPLIQFSSHFRATQGTNILLEAAILSEIDGGRLSRSSPPIESCVDAESEVTRRSEAASALARLQDEPAAAEVASSSSAFLSSAASGSTTTPELVTLSASGFDRGWTLIDPKDVDANSALFEASETIIHAQDGTIFQTGDGTILAVEGVVQIVETVDGGRVAVINEEEKEEGEESKDEQDDKEQAEKRVTMIKSTSKGGKDVNKKVLRKMGRTVAEEEEEEAAFLFPKVKKKKRRKEKGGGEDALSLAESEAKGAERRRNKPNSKRMKTREREKMPLESKEEVGGKSKNRWRRSGREEAEERRDRGTGIKRTRINKTVDPD